MTSSSSPTIDVILNININILNHCSIDKVETYARPQGNNERPTAICIDINVQPPQESHNNHAATASNSAVLTKRSRTHDKL
eukprot:scaffold125723_cov87-Cyclotella_meneghiniana.AAC.2